MREGVSDNVWQSPALGRELPPAALRSLLVYNLFFPLVFLAVLPGVLRRTLRRGNYKENFGQRLGRYTAEQEARFRDGRWIWIHSISVGETLVALKLARQIHKLLPEQNVVISVTTSTGWALANSTAESWLAVVYNPLDRPAIVRHALDVLRPEQVIFVEGEAWPNLLAECFSRGIPTSMVNARLSPRSEARLRCVRFWTGPIFNLLDRICVPETSDLARWRTLGIEAGRLQHTGSIKFDLGAAACEVSKVAQFRTMLAGIGVPVSAPILVAGSTWAPEETLLADVLGELRRRFPDLFLILVPRHVERTGEILRALGKWRVVLRSNLPKADAGPVDILLVDTTGELRHWYELATVVFVGKSMPGISDVGGQNPAEPAALGKAVVFGPHMENFKAVVDLLKTHEAVSSVNSGTELAGTIGGLLETPAERDAMGQRAMEALQVHQGATERAAQAVLGII